MSSNGNTAVTVGPNRFLGADAKRTRVLVTAINPKYVDTGKVMKASQLPKIISLLASIDLTSCSPCSKIKGINGPISLKLELIKFNLLQAVSHH
jgi:hypothetical protein